MPTPAPAIFDAPHGTRIAYYKTGGKGPMVVFMGGLMSDMTGTKATFLETLCRKQGRGFLRFDYGGHGASSGTFEEGTIGSWHKDALAALDHLTTGPLIVIGSSMGGWQALLAALARRERVKGLIGLAPAPDFTEKLLLKRMLPQHRAELMEKGRVEVPSDYGDKPYIFTRALIEEGRNHLLLEGPIDLNIPVRIIHGLKDNDVPHWVSLEIMDHLAVGDSELILVKNGDHSLSAPSDLARIEKVLAEVLERI